MSIFVDLRVPDDALRQTLYDGNLVILTRLKSVSEFVEHARHQLTELFSPYDPEYAHEHFDKAEMARILGSWKPAFIHSERSERLVRQIIQEGRFRPREHLLRRAQAVYFVPCRAPDDRYCFRLPLAPRRLV